MEQKKTAERTDRERKREREYKNDELSFHFLLIPRSYCFDRFIHNMVT
jgi:hypothetical protein